MLITGYLIQMEPVKGFRWGWEMKFRQETNILNNNSKNFCTLMPLKMALDKQATCLWSTKNSSMRVASYTVQVPFHLTS